eukprot:a508423_4029.p1 GENE.a508423_4029~~a508423_4029.p1  ORF type:complete len:163 (-),score=72.94 a508423_4029:104-550(-)
MAGSPADTWREVTDQANPKNWMICDSQLNLVASGEGGLEELKSSLDPAQVQFAGFVVYGVDDRGSTVSKRTKSIFVVWIGPGVGALARGKALRMKDQAVQLYQGAGLSIDCDDSSELSTKNISERLLASGGAHKPTSYDFGGGNILEL